ncbi:MAG: hypothetical protein CMK92_05070 [Pseudomonas sp.]|nr:hypothetical protein [Pseudomonas sp.]
MAGASAQYQRLINDQTGTIYRALHRPDNFRESLNKAMNDQLDAAYKQFIDTQKAEANRRGMTYVKPEGPREKQIVDNLRSKLRYNDIISSLSKNFVMPVHREFKPSMGVSMEYVYSQINGGALNFGSQATFKLPAAGHFITDCAIRVRIGSISAINDGDRVRWTTLLGHRLFREVAFHVNGNELDRYTTEDMNHHLQYNVPSGKRTAYLRAIGQETPHEGYVVADPAKDNHREKISICDGNQTFKHTHGEIELIVPLRFWFNELRDALPNCALSRQSCTVTVDIENVVNLIAFADYVGDGSYTQPTIKSMELISGHVTVTEEVAKLYQTRMGVQLVPIHQQQTLVMSPNEGMANIQLDSKYAVESLIVAARPTENETNTQTWHRNEVLTVNLRAHPVANPPNPGDPAVAAYVEAQWYSGVPSLKSLKLTLDGIPMYDTQTSLLFRDYLPLNRKEINAPESGDLHMIPFTREPNADNPSGTLDMGRLQEALLQLTPSDEAFDKEMKIFIHTRALALFIIKDGTIVHHKI